MSRRTRNQETLAATLRIAHLAQIEALTAPGLTREERLQRRELLWLHMDWIDACVRG